MTMRILCTADIHLGRHPSQIADRPDRHDLAPAAAWRSFVQTAIDRQVDVVALTGDVVDEANKFYEAFSELYAGVQRLVEAGITPLAVAGNHDYDVLPRLAEQLPQFHLLGRGGQWQQWLYDGPDGAQVRFQGWSFPARHVAASPLADYPPPTDALPTVGLLHCDCGAPRSSYAPVALADLRATGIAAWLLGHVHAPAVLSEAHPLVLYPGSLQGLDPGEPGRRAAVLLSLSPGPALVVEHLPLAPLRWEHLQVDVDGAGDAEALQQAVVEALTAHHQAIAEDLGAARLVGCRLQLQGRTALHRHLLDLVPSIRDDLRPRFDGVEYFIESIHIAARPAVALEEIARSADPAGLLARRILLLERGEPAEQYRELIAGGRRAVEQARGRGQFAPLQADQPPPDDEQVRQLLLQAGLQALDELLAQKEEAPS